MLTVLQPHPTHVKTLKPPTFHAKRPILFGHHRKVFGQQDDRTNRYCPLTIKLLSDPASRPQQQEVLIEFYRKGKVDEALRAFKKIYLEVVH
jgi:hypothetical protein